MDFIATQLCVIDSGAAHRFSLTKVGTSFIENAEYAAIYVYIYIFELNEGIYIAV